MSTGFETTKTIASFLIPACLRLCEDAVEERDVAVDEIEARLVRLAAQTGGDADDVRIRAIGVGAGVDVLVRAKCRAVEEVERLALGRGLVGVEDDDLLDDAASTGARMPRRSRRGRRRR